jgi:hypothetical protein
VWHQKKKEEAEIDTLPCRYCVRGHISDPFLFGFLLLLPPRCHVSLWKQGADVASIFEYF